MNGVLAGVAPEKGLGDETMHSEAQKFKGKFSPLSFLCVSICCFSSGTKWLA